ncbi:DUF6636 domain-containing protein [Nocardia coubleae]|uniref:Uncharacterized protein n=1 Tax=Nocardia coubleae TaxID=356147 RepID=A0A846WDC0_9NOCA|nr:DUF6636 domain-containing protein [Nocardia coubleae]NKX91529.1 hypothetical protein [Nocardia coubleae]
MRTVLMLAAVAALTGGLTACGAESGSSLPSTTTQHSATYSSDAPSTVRPSSAPDAGSPDANSPGATSPGAGSPGAGNPDTEAPDTPKPSTAPAPDKNGFTTVDAGKYLLDGGYYFQSPTGNIMCGFLTAAPYGVGCQLGKANIISPKLPNCTDAPNRKVAAHLYQGKSELLCTSQGIFVGIPQDGSPAGGAVLNYGQSVTVNGYTCDSSSQGVRCMADGHGFAISADDQHAF